MSKSKAVSPKTNELKAVESLPVQKTKGRPHFLVIDDDPTFRALLKRVAESEGFRLTVCSSLKEVKPMTAAGTGFDAVILDYYLDDIKDNLRGTEVAWVLEGTPVILISSQERCLEENDGAWPGSIRRFVNKKLGAKAILETAASVVAT